VGSHFAKLADQAGFKVVALSDALGGIYHPQGLEVSNMIQAQQQGGTLTKNVCYPKLSLQDTGEVSGDCEPITNQQLLELKVDILVPAAIENQITQENAARIQAPVILELANGPITPEADDIVQKNNKVVIPDILANAGGVTASYYEWTQNIQNLYWSEQEVNEKIETKMRQATQEVLEIHNKRHVTMREAAYELALHRLEEAMLLRGWVHPRPEDTIGRVNKN
jgi:glutamate dehydrogenase/leucine dehydrogenase